MEPGLGIDFFCCCNDQARGIITNRVFLCVEVGGS